MSTPEGPHWLVLPKRALWTAFGLACVAIGTIGIVVPGLPTTVFFIAAAGCFTKSSPRLERWVLDLPRIGPAVRDYRAGLGMRRRAKAFAIGCITVFSSFAIWVVLPSTLVGGVIAGAAVAGVVFILWRVPTREVVVADRRTAPAR